MALSLLGIAMVPILATAMVIALGLWVLRSKREPAVLPWTDALDAVNAPGQLLFRRDTPRAAVASAGRGSGTVASSAASGVATPSSSSSIRVAVVGGGLAGCTAARLLARHGADVTLFEAEDELGGRAASHTRQVGRWKTRVESGIDCVTSGSAALDTVARIAGVTDDEQSPVDEYVYIFEHDTPTFGVTLPGRNCGSVLRMGHALHIMDRARLLWYRLQCASASRRLDPWDPLNLCLPHPLTKSLPTLAALADAVLGVSARKTLIEALARSMFQVDAGQLPAAYLPGMLGGFGMANRWKAERGMSQIVDGLVGAAPTSNAATDWVHGTEDERSGEDASGTNEGALSLWICRATTWVGELGVGRVFVCRLWRK